MGYFETNEVADQENVPVPATTVIPRKKIVNRTVSWLVGVILLLSVLMLTLTLLQGKAEQNEINDLNATESLDTYSHLIFKETEAHSSVNRQPILAEIDEVRGRLRTDYPDEVHSTDPAWDRFTQSIKRSNSVSRPEADAVFAATRDLGSAIKASGQEKFAEGLWLYAAGALGLVLVLLKVLRTDQENIIGTISLHHDRSFSSSVLDNLDEGILACDAEGKLTLINKATRDFYGVNGDSISGDNWSSHFVMYTADGSRELKKSEHPLHRALAGEQITGLEVLVVNDLGPSRYCTVNGRSIVDDVDKKLGAVIVLHDISERRRAQQEAMRLASIVECSADAILGVNLDGFLVSWNAAATELYGFDETEMVGSHISVLANPGEVSPIIGAIKALVNGQTIEAAESSLINKDGARVELSLRYSPIRDTFGNCVGISATARDITVRKQAEEALEESRKRLADAQRVARMGSWEFDPETSELIWSDQMFLLFEFDPAKGTPRYSDVFRRYHAEDLKPVRAAHDLAINNGKKYELDIRIVLGDGSIRYCQMVGEPVLDSSGKTVRLIGTAMDISERKKAEQLAKEASIALEFQKKALEEANARLESLATSDGLTGLRNRRALDAQLEQEFARSSRYKANLSLLLLDIDKFKNYNDSFGHQAGDDVLREVAKILQKGTRESDIVARYGGEELCIVLPETPFVEAGRIAERLRIAVSKCPWDRREVTVSIGVSTYLPSMKNAADLLLAADQALYVSKESGRNKITLAPGPDETLKAA